VCLFCTVIEIFNLQYWRDLEIWIMGCSRSLKQRRSIDHIRLFIRLLYTPAIVGLSIAPPCTIFEFLTLNNIVTSNGSLLYGVEACPLLVRDRKSFDFTIIRSFMKLFRTGSVSIVTDCQKFSYFLPVTYQIDIRTVKFLQKFQSSDNHICNLFSKKAETT